MTVVVEGPGIPGRRITYADCRGWDLQAGVFLVEATLGEWVGFSPGVWSTFEIS